MVTSAFKRDERTGAYGRKVYNIATKDADRRCGEAVLFKMKVSSFPDVPLD
jgi:hypothetical protein